MEPALPVPGGSLPRSLPGRAWGLRGAHCSSFQPHPTFPTGPGQAAAEVSYFPPAELFTTEPKSKYADIFCVCMGARARGPTLTHTPVHVLHRYGL